MVHETAIHQVLGLSQSDKRLIDAEILLKYISNRINLDKYSGNLKRYLDNTTIALNKNWSNEKPHVEALYKQFNNGIGFLSEIGGIESVGKYSGESRFVRNLFDVQIYFFSQLQSSDINNISSSKYLAEFTTLSMQDSAFRKAISTATNTKSNFVTRFEQFRVMMNDAFNKNFPPLLGSE